MTKGILVISHGRPAFSKGGGEIAAYNFYKTYNELGYDTYFMGAHRFDEINHGGTPFSAFSDREILYHSTMKDFFLNILDNRDVVCDGFLDLLDYIDPDIIHFHHYIHVGIELLRWTRNWIEQKKPGAKLFLTLHEYIAICANNGQMIKTGNGKLCNGYKPVECKQCFPQHSTIDFKLRELYLKSYFDAVDHFISPSEFLKERYVKWGVAADKISVIENGQLRTDKLSPRELKPDETRSVFAYFGQINPYKGLDVLLSALEYLPKKVRKSVEIQIHGSGLENQEEAFRNKVSSIMRKYKKQVKYFGPYEPDELSSLMQNIDWVVMPSVWWENSPLVIQEGLKYGRPLMVSNIGGMADKVEHLKNGIHFQYKNSQDLANWMMKAIDLDFYEGIYQGMSEPVWIEESAKTHLELYEKDKNEFPPPFL